MKHLLQVSHKTSNKLSFFFVPDFKPKPASPEDVNRIAESYCK